jgi:hypothetical protein
MASNTAMIKRALAALTLLCGTSAPAFADTIDAYCESEARISAVAVTFYVTNFDEDKNVNLNNREFILDKSLIEIKKIWGFNSRLVGQMLGTVQNLVDDVDNLMRQRGYSRFENEKAFRIGKTYQNSSYRACLQRAAKIK